LSVGCALKCYEGGFNKMSNTTATLLPVDCKRFEDVCVRIEDRKGSSINDVTALGGGGIKDFMVTL